MIVKKVLWSFALLFFMHSTAFSQKSADEMLASAKAQAKKEHKAVFVKFEASWCGWCKRMTAKMEAPETKKMLEDQYVVVHLVVMESSKNKKLENPGAEKLLKKYHGDKAGLPFWLILDDNLNLITDAYNSKKQNLGCPATPEEVDEFAKKLKKSSKLTNADLKTIKEVFVKK
ncbi:MAG: thioredoxin family protein [Polaribacter sp.]